MLEQGIGPNQAENLCLRKDFTVLTTCQATLKDETESHTRMDQWWGRTTPCLELLSCANP